MKYIVTIALILSFNLIADNKTKFGSECGLVDNWGDVEDTSTTFDLTQDVDNAKELKRLEKRVKSLPKIVKSQLIKAASDLNDKAIRDSLKAVKYLKEMSEGGDLYIVKAEVKGKKYSVVSYYGGGNHTGYIFPWGSATPVAEIGDDDVVCTKK